MLQVSKEEWARGYQEVKDNLERAHLALIWIRMDSGLSGVVRDKLDEAIRLVNNTGTIVRSMTF